MRLFIQLCAVLCITFTVSCSENDTVNDGMTTLTPQQIVNSSTRLSYKYSGGNVYTRSSNADPWEFHSKSTNWYGAVYPSICIGNGAIDYRLFTQPMYDSDLNFLYAWNAYNKTLNVPAAVYVRQNITCTDVNLSFGKNTIEKLTLQYATITETSVVNGIQYRWDIEYTACEPFWEESEQARYFPDHRSALEYALDTLEDYFGPDIPRADGSTVPAAQLRQEVRGVS